MKNSQTAKFLWPHFPLLGSVRLRGKFRQTIMSSLSIWLSPLQKGKKKCYVWSFCSSLWPSPSLPFFQSLRLYMTRTIHILKWHNSLRSLWKRNATTTAFFAPNLLLSGGVENPVCPPAIFPLLLLLFPKGLFGLWKQSEGSLAKGHEECWQSQIFQCWRGAPNVHDQ